ALRPAQVRRYCAARPSQFGAWQQILWPRPIGTVLVQARRSIDAVLDPTVPAAAGLRQTVLGALGSCFRLRGYSKQPVSDQLVVERSGRMRFFPDRKPRVAWLGLSSPHLLQMLGHHS